MLKNLAGATAAGGTLAMAWSAYTRRPLSFLADPDALDERRRPVVAAGTLTAAPAETTNSCKHDSQSPDSLLHVATRAAVLSSITAISRAYLEITGVSVSGLDRFHDHLNAAEQTGRPVLTVANHMSVYDDPIVLSYIAPRAAYTAPRRHR